MSAKYENKSGWRKNRSINEKTDMIYQIFDDDNERITIKMKIWIVVG